MNKIILSAGIINIIAALIHTIMGHFFVIIPFMGFQYLIPTNALLHSCWHMITITLFFTSIIFLYIGIKPQKLISTQISALLGVLYVGYALVFIIVSIAYGIFLPHSILLLPIGILAIYDWKKQFQNNSKSL